MPVTKPDADPRMPYQLPFPKDAQEEIVVPSAIPTAVHCIVIVRTIPE